MSLLNRIVKAVRPNSFRDVRAYRRFKVKVRNYVRVDAFGSAGLWVEDLSFGGFAMALPEGITAEPGSGPLTMTLTILDERLPVLVGVVRGGDGVIGCKLIGQQVETVYALHGVLQALQLGADLVPDKAKPGPGLHLVAGGICRLEAGPVKAIGKAVDMTLSYTHDGKPWELVVRDGKIASAGNTLAPGAGGSQPRVVTGKLERRVLRQAVFILCGLAGSDAAAALKPVEDLCLAALGVSIPSEARDTEDPGVSGEPS